MKKKSIYSLKAINILVIIAMIFGGVALDFGPVEAALGDIVITAPTTQVVVKEGDTVPVSFTVDSSGKPGAGEFQILLVDEYPQLDPVPVPVTGPVSVIFTGGTAQSFTSSFVVPSGLLDGIYDLAVEVNFLAETDFLNSTKLDDMVKIDNTVTPPVLVSPVGGDFWAIGSSQTISWQTYAPGEPVTIDLSFSADDGGSWSVIAEDVPNADYTWLVPTPATATAMIKVDVTDAVGNTAEVISGAFNIYAVDSSAPEVAMLAPLNNTTVDAPVGLEASAADPESGIAEVMFERKITDGEWITIGEGVLDDTTYILEWDTELSGAVMIRAMATNGIGLEAYSAPITVTIQQADITPPAVTLVTPITDEVVGYNYQFLVTATDTGSGLASLEIFAVDTTPEPDVETKLCDLTPTETDNQFSCIADVPAGTKLIKAVVKDVAGNSGDDSANVVVDLTAPVLGDGLTVPANGAVLQLGGSVGISWDDIEEDHLDSITLELRRGGVVIDTIATIASGTSYSWTVAGPPAADYAVCMVVVDEAGNSAEDCNSPITIWGVDNTAPVVTLTAPSAANYKGTVALEATASDAQTFIQKVEFFVGIVKVGEDLAAPYELSWDSTTVADGTYSIKAVATNGVGLTAESTPVDVIIDNTAPVLSNMQPSTAAPISGSVTFSVEAVDAGVGFGTVVFEYFDVETEEYVELAQVEEVVNKYSTVSFDTTTVPDGWLEVRVTATDLAGNESTLTSNYLVQNGEPEPGEAIIGLQTGWNLISLPLIPDAPAIDDVLADLIAHGSVKQVVAWPFEGDTIHEKRWNGGALLDFDEIVDGAGYWVEMNTADVLSFGGAVMPEPPLAPPSYIVHAGWNLIGFKSMVGMAANEYLGEAGQGNMRAMYGFNESTGLYGQILGTDNLLPGNGYWLAVSVDATIYPPAGIDS